VSTIKRVPTTPNSLSKNEQPSTVRCEQLTFVHWAIDTVAAVVVAPIFVVVAPTWSTVTVVPIGRQFARVLCVAKGTRASSFNGVGDTIVVTNKGIARGLPKKKETSESWSCDGVQQYSVRYQPTKHPAAEAITTATTIAALNKQHYQHHHQQQQQQQQQQQLLSPL
jgi:hypothetical protein